MSELIYEWEKYLHHLAFHGLDQKEVDQRSVEINDFVLAQAFQLAKSITERNSKTFYLASALLPPEKRKAIRALYAFCRVSDDLVDLQKNDPRKLIDSWQNPSAQPNPDEDALLALAWAETRRKYQIPWRYSEQLIEGVSRDISQTRYDDFTDLAQYSYGVASTVGLMSMHIIGFKGEEAYPYAIRLGVALQLTNILRDIGEDWRSGRVYLPKNELEAYDLNYEDLAKGIVTPKWRSFMRFQIARNRRLYAQAKPGIALLNRDGRFAITAAADLYEAILKEIENNDYNVFTQRASVSKGSKIKMLPMIWKRSRTGYPSTIY